MQDFAGKKILLLDGLTSQCLEYTKAFNCLGCETTVLCDDRFDVCYASKYPKRKILGISNSKDLVGTEKWIIDLVSTGEYDIVIPFTDYSSTILSCHKAELSEYAHLIVNNPSEFEFAIDKNNVMRKCMELNIPCPRTLFNINSASDIELSDVQFPIVIKPRSGFGSQGFHRVDNINQFESLVNDEKIDLTKMVVQEYIPKTGLNVADNLFVDKNGDIKSAFTYASSRFYPIDGGSGVLNYTIDRQDVHEIAAKIVKELNLRGPVGVDLIIDSRDDIPKVLEVNLRAIACAKVGFLSGVNQAKQILEDLYCDSVTSVTKYKTDIRVRRSQIDWMWFLKSKDRFKTNPSWFDRKNTFDQLFSLDDPGPWFAFWIYGIKKFLHEHKG